MCTYGVLTPIILAFLLEGIQLVRARLPFTGATEFSIHFISGYHLAALFPEYGLGRRRIQPAVMELCSFSDVFESILQMNEHSLLKQRSRIVFISRFRSSPGFRFGLAIALDEIGIEFKEFPLYNFAL